jgi:hypothetical protein
LYLLLQGRRPDSAIEQKSATKEKENAMSTRILALVGSLRSGSDNRRLAEAAVNLAPSGMSVEIFDGLADVALYNEDIDPAGGRRGCRQAARRSSVGRRTSARNP